MLALFFNKANAPENAVKYAAKAERENFSGCARLCQLPPEKTFFCASRGSGRPMFSIFARRVL